MVRALAGLSVILFGASVVCPAFAAKKKPPAHPIDLNTATIEQLELLPGIGPVTAKRIIEFRQKSGPFRKIEDLLAIPRITKARLEKLRPYVTIKPAKSEIAPAKEKHKNSKFENRMNRVS